MAARTVSSIIDIKHTLRLVYQHAVKSVNSCYLIKKELKCSEDRLIVGNRSYKLNDNVYLVGFGKAVLGMGYQTELQIGRHLKNGILSIPVGQRDTFSELLFKPDSVIKILEGAKNNIPDDEAENTAKEIVNLINNLTEKDILLVLISGGGSALLPLPIPPVALQDKVNVIKLLQTSGADITELNSVRKRLSVIKGGGLLSLAYPAQVIAFILSDIVGDPLDQIASGPTVIDKDSPEKARMIFEKYALIDKIPDSVREVVKGPVRKNSVSTDVQNILIGTNRIALEAAMVNVKKHNYDAIILTDSLEGLVSQIFNSYIKFVECICQVMFENDALSKDDFITKLRPFVLELKIENYKFMEFVDMIYQSRPAKLCLLLGGEPTVEITGSGKGGRSQQLCLQFSNALHALYNSHNELMRNFNIGLLCGGTDGIDGPTDAAGAVAYNGQMDTAFQQNLDPNIFIENCDSYTFFSQLNNGEDLIKVGHTGTNVMDIHILLIEFIKH